MKKVLLICLAVCFVLALSALAFDDMGKSSTVNGWVSDSKCGAKGANASAAACTKKCLEGGANMVMARLSAIATGVRLIRSVTSPTA